MEELGFTRFSTRSPLTDSTGSNYEIQSWRRQRDDTKLLSLLVFSYSPSLGSIARFSLGSPSYIFICITLVSSASAATAVPPEHKEPSDPVFIQSNSSRRGMRGNDFTSNTMLYV